MNFMVGKMIVGKNMIKKDDEINYFYLFDEIDSYNWMKVLCESLKESNITIKHILVKNLSDVGEGPDECSFENIEDYLNSFNKTIFENSINWINIKCMYQNLDMIISVDAHMNRMQITIYGEVDNISFDNIVASAVNKSKRSSVYTEYKGGR